MIIFNLTLDLARLDAHRSVDNITREIAKILHVNRDNVVLCSVPDSISAYRLRIGTEGNIKKARLLMSKLKNAKLAPIKSVQLRQIKKR